MYIVTGGAGFIGSNIVRALNAKGIHDIVIVDDLENGDKHRNMNSLSFIDYVDKRDFFEEAGLFSDTIDAIVHMGACADTTERNGRYMLKENYDFSKTLLDFAVEAESPFIYASSASVYGNGEKGFRETRACEYPLNVYAFSKYLFDNLVRQIIDTAPIQIVGLRFFNVYGPQENHKGRMASVVYNFHKQIQRDGKLRLFEGSDAFVRDFIHVDDIAKIALHFLDNGTTKGIVNCGTGTAESFMRLAKIMEGLYENASIEEIPFPDDLKGRYQTFTKADTANLRALGYTSEFIGLEEGVASYVKILKESEGYYA